MRREAEDEGRSSFVDLAISFHICLAKEEEWDCETLDVPQAAAEAAQSVVQLAKRNQLLKILKPVGSVRELRGTCISPKNGARLTAVLPHRNVVSAAMIEMHLRCSQGDPNWGTIDMRSYADA